MADQKIQDAEFVDVNPPDGTAPPRSTAFPRAVAYGRRTVAGGADAKTRARAAAGALDAIADLSRTGARMAQAVGADAVAEKAIDAADLAHAGADVVRTGVVAAEGVAREIGPLRKSWNTLVDRAKEAGVVGPRKRHVLTLNKRPIGPRRPDAATAGAAGGPKPERQE